MNSKAFVFFGTDAFSAVVLAELKKAGFLPARVVTAPDRPKGRGLALTPPPAKLWAIENSVPVLQPERLDSAVAGQLSKVNSSLFVVASYGAILPKEILAIPKHGTLNVHPSLLPKYRGASPIESAILADDRDTGVSIMLMDEQMDHGPIVALERIQDSGFRIQEWPPSASVLKAECARIGGELLAKTIPLWLAGKIQAVPQDHAKATYTKKIKKEDGLIRLADDPYKNFLKIRAFDGSIGTFFFTERNGKKLRVAIKDAKFAEGALTLTRVVPEGRKEMSYDAFLQGLH